MKQFLDEKNYDEKREENLASRCGFAMNMHLEGNAHHYEFPAQPGDRPILVRTPIYVGGQQFQVLAHLAYAGVEMNEGEPTLVLDSDLYLVTSDDYDQIVKLLTERNQ